VAERPEILAVARPVIAGEYGTVAVRTVEDAVTALGPDAGSLSPRKPNGSCPSVRIGVDRVAHRLGLAVAMDRRADPEPTRQAMKPEAGARSFGHQGGASPAMVMRGLREAHAAVHLVSGAASAKAAKPIDIVAAKTNVEAIAAARPVVITTLHRFDVLFIVA
jgi:hypothetical protein